MCLSTGDSYDVKVFIFPAEKKLLTSLLMGCTVTDYINQ